jgi:hypothetical protein
MMLQTRQEAQRQERLYVAFTLFAVLAFVLFLAPEQALAYSGQDEWGMEDLWDKIKSFFTGIPGLIIALIMLIAGFSVMTKSMIGGGIIIIAAFAILMSTKIAEKVTGLVV